RRAVGGEPLAQPRGDGVIAGVARALAQRGKPAGAEVDRVQGEPERGQVLMRALAEVRVGAGARPRPAGAQASRVLRDGGLVDVYVSRAGRHLCTGVTQLGSA